jgi:hypothetical protein
MHDHVICLDGPLEGRRFVTDSEVPEVLGFEVLVDSDQRVLAAEYEHPPAYREMLSLVLVYDVARASDGFPSRGDDGCIRLAYRTAQDAPL